jgi:hypothetical protein
MSSQDDPKRRPTSELDGDSQFHTVDSPHSTWVAIERVGTEEEARLLEGFLEAEGIPTEVEVVKFTMEPVNFGEMGEIRIYVAAENEQEANELLRRRNAEYESLSSDSDSLLTDEGPADMDENSETIEEPEEE